MFSGLTGTASKEATKQFLKSLPFVSMLLMVVFGVALLGFGLTYRGDLIFSVEVWSLPWWARLAAEVGKLLLAGGFLAAFLRVFQILQIMEKALEHFMMSEGFLKLATDFEGVWSKITTRLYLNGTDMKENDEFFKKVQQTIQQQLYYDKNYYVRNMHHSIRAELQEDDKKYILVDNVQEYEVIALDDKPIELRFRFKARDSVSLDAYELGEEKIEIESIDTSVQCSPQSKHSVDGEMTVKIITLIGHKGYKIRRSRKEKWLLDDDPFYEIITRTVCENFKFTCAIPKNDLQTSFIEYGVKDRFVDKSPRFTENDRPGDQLRELEGIMLPHNGYAIYFERL